MNPASARCSLAQTKAARCAVAGSGPCSASLSRMHSRARGTEARLVFYRMFKRDTPRGARDLRPESHIKPGEEGHRGTAGGRVRPAWV